MLTKILKYDFGFSAKMFFTMSSIIIGFSVILRFAITSFWYQLEAQTHMLVMAFTSPIMIGLVFVAAACVAQIFMFYGKSFFGNGGYLMLTLPVSRANLLVSKVIVSMVWFNFMLLTFAAAALIAFEGVAPNNYGGVLRHYPISELIKTAITLNSVAFYFICTLFFCVTLSRSVIIGRKIHGIISGIIGFIYIWFVISSADKIDWRSRAMQSLPGANWSQEMPLVGLRYGRLVIEQRDFGWSVFIDLYQIGFFVAMGVLALGVALYLLRKKIVLR